MSGYFPPKINTEYIFYVSLVDSANRPYFKANPTIASGDFKLSTDGGSLTNLDTLPVVTPVSGVLVKFTLSTSEMNGNNATVVCIDEADAEWDDLVINIQTATRQIDDLAFPTAPGRSMDVTVTGVVGIDFDNIEGTLKNANLDSDLDSYQAYIQLTDDDNGSADRYSATWFKNGEPITSGITSPTIQVIKDADGTDLIAVTAMTEVASQGHFRYIESTNRIIDGVAYKVKIQATIGGATRTWGPKPISRDS
jgi:hypothetical protein